MNFLRAFLFYSLVGLSLPIQAMAQDNKETKAERMEKIHNAKIAFISNKLNLTPEQSKQFWPVYNEYESKKDHLHKQSKVFRHVNIDEMTDQQLLEGIRKVHNVRQKELNLEKEYTDQLLKVLSVRQVVNLYKAEREFTRALLHKIKNR